MTHYSEEFRASIAARLLPPNNASISDIMKETGIPKDTLYDWRAKYRNKSVVSANAVKSAKQYSADEKLSVIIETAVLNEIELSEYCRTRGIYPVQIANWKAGIVHGLKSEPDKACREQNRNQSKTIQNLEKELARKEKALAEVAALLVLQKKFQALMEASEAN